MGKQQLANYIAKQLFFGDTWTTRFVFCHVIAHVIAPAAPAGFTGFLIASREPRKTRKMAEDKGAHRRRRNNLKPVDPKE